MEAESFLRSCLWHLTLVLVRGAKDTEEEEKPRVSFTSETNGVNLGKLENLPAEKELQ